MDGGLYEMYYNVAPSLLEAVQGSGSGENCADIYNQQFSICLSLIAEGKLKEAGSVFKVRLDEMISKYLFKN